MIFVVERLIDLAADQLGLDRVALRRRNMIPAAEQPFANPLGLTYDSGDYTAAMDTALTLGDWGGFAARRAETKRRGALRGIGIANYVEVTSGSPRERTEITVHPNGRVELVMGTMDPAKATQPALLSSSPNGSACRSGDRLCGARHGAGCGRWRLAFGPFDETGDDDHRPGNR